MNRVKCSITSRSTYAYCGVSKDKQMVKLGNSCTHVFDQILIISINLQTRKIIRKWANASEFIRLCFEYNYFCLRAVSINKASSLWQFFITACKIVNQRCKFAISFHTYVADIVNFCGYK